MNQLTLKPHQRLLVKWFDKYRIKISQEAGFQPDVEERQRNESLSVKDIQMMHQDHDSSPSSDEDETLKDRIENKKHTKFMDDS